MEPKRFTTEELQQKYSPNTTIPSDQINTPKRFTTDELRKKYSTDNTTTNTEPSFGGKIVRGIIKPFAKLGTSLVNLGQDIAGKEETQPFSGDYLGKVEKIGAGFDPSKGFTPENVKAIKDSVGTGLDIASNIPVVKGLGLTKTAIAQPFKQTALQVAKNVGKEGLVQGGLSGAGTALQENKDIGSVLSDAALGTALGGAGGFVLGGAGTKVSRAFSKTPAEFTSKIIDKDIRKAYQGTTGDVEKIDKMAFGSKKGLELLVNEAPNIKIPDSKAPLGSGATKPFDIKNATANEFITGLNQLKQKVVNNAKTAVKEAKEKGFTLKTEGAKDSITQAVNNGDISPATASRLYKQIDNTKGDPEKIFDWVQEVNSKYKNRFEKGTIDDMATSRIANDIAENFRKELNTITDRTGYAESIANVKDLERLLIAVAKKANKSINFGDITSEAGLDAGISLLTGNPAYMARTLGSGIFKGIVGKLQNTQGLRSVKSAIKGVSKIPNKTKLPSTKLKQERLLLPAPKKDNIKSQNFIAPKLPARRIPDEKSVSRNKPKLK